MALLSGKPSAASGQKKRDRSSACKESDSRGLWNRTQIECNAPGILQPNSDERLDAGAIEVGEADRVIDCVGPVHLAAAQIERDAVCRPRPEVTSGVIPVPS